MVNLMNGHRPFILFFYETVKRCQSISSMATNTKLRQQLSQQSGVSLIFQRQFVFFRNVLHYGLGLWPIQPLTLALWKIIPMKSKKKNKYHDLCCVLV